MLNNFRLPAEWENHSFSLITWPSENTDWAYMLDEVRQCFASLAVAILKFEPLVIVTDDKDGVLEYIDADKYDSLFFVECSINDTWARDHAFITTTDGKSFRLNDFQFNGWGLKFAANYDNQINKCIYVNRLQQDSANMYVSRLDTVLEGGSIESDGCGTLLTTTQCLFAPNRNNFVDKEAAERVLRESLGAQRVLWLDYGYLDGDDTDSHVDTLARLAPNNTIVYVQAWDEENSHTDALRNMEEELRSFRNADGKPYRLVPLPMTPPIYDPESGERLPATYANFYFVNGAILLPVYNVETDFAAVDALDKAFHDHVVVPVDCRALIRQHGSLHCSTMQFPGGLCLSNN